MADSKTDARRRHNPFEAFRREDRRTPVLAFLITLCLHVSIVAVLPERILFPSRAYDKNEPLSVEIDLPDPDRLRFVEANPEAPENEPNRKDRYSFRDQQAADDVPEEDSSNVPRVDGEEATTEKILQGDPSPPAPLSPGLYSSEIPSGEGAGTAGGKKATRNEVLFTPPKTVPPPDFLKAESLAEEGQGSHPNIEGEAEERIESLDSKAPLDVYKSPSITNAAAIPSADDGGGRPAAKPIPKARPRLSPELLHGPLMSSVGSSGRKGQLALDASFSQFGEYERQFYAAVQVGWYQEIDFFQPIDRAAHVVVRFTMDADGSIRNVETIETNAGGVATLICENAIIKRSPFRPWTEEMIEVFGESRTLRVVFHYR